MLTLMKPVSMLRFLFYLTITSLFLVGLLGFFCTYMPYEWVKFQLDTLSVDGNANRFTQTVYLSIIAKLTLFSYASIILAILAFTCRKIFLNKLGKVQQQLKQALYELWVDIKNDLSQISHDSDKLHLYLLLIILLGGFAFRVLYLFQPLRHDEAFTFTNYASKPLFLALSNYSFPNNHLFHTLCVHISYLIFGNHTWAIRLPAFLAGIATLPVSYLLVRALYGKHTALITVGLIAVSSALIEYATNARGYAFIILLFLLTLSIANYLRKKNNTVAWLFLSILFAIGFHTVPVMLYPCGTVLLWMVLSAWQNDFSLSLKQTCLQLFKCGIVTVLLTSLLYLPVILASGMDAIIHNRFVQPMPISTFMAHLPTRLSDVWLQWSRDYSPILTTILMIFCGVALLFHRQMAQHKIGLALPACLSLAILLPTQGVLPPERVWLYLLPIFLMLVSVGIMVLIGQTLPYQMHSKAAMIITLCLSTWSIFGANTALNNYYPFGPGTLKDAEEITQYLKPQLQSGDRLVTIATAAPLEYYFQKHQVPIDYLRESFTQSTRLIVLVLEKKYTLDQVLKTAKIPAHEFSSPKLWQSYPSARLYEMNRFSTVSKTDVIQ